MNEHMQSVAGQAETINENVRVLLWDIDGTILQSRLGGEFKKYFAAALEKVYGTAGKIGQISAAGATDSQIVFRALEDEGFTVEDVFAKLDEFTEVLCCEMKSYVAAHEDVYEILPGVRAILEAIGENPRF